MLKKLIPLFCFLLISPIGYAENSGIVYKSEYTFYTGRENSIFLDIPQDIASSTLFWNLRYSGRTIKKGVIPQAKKTELKKINFSFPKLNPGVIANVSFSCTDKSGKKLLEKQLFFYPANPFENCSEFLKQENISLWIPDEDKKLVELLNSFKVSFKTVSSLSEVDTNSRILIISGLNYDSFPGIQEDIVNFTRSGPNKKVIIIPPLAGQIPLDTQDYWKISLARNKIIKEWDKKLDDKNWGGSQLITTTGLNLFFDNSVSIKIDALNEENPFSCCVLAVGESKIFICGWDILGRSADSPTPVYLLKTLIFNQNKI